MVIDLNERIMSPADGKDLCCFIPNGGVGSSNSDNGVDCSNDGDNSLSILLGGRSECGI